jgi:hypothetical protein
MLLLGVILLLSGILSETLYISNSRVAYNNVVASDSYLVTGAIFIVIGFILTLFSVKIAKIRVP